MIIFTEVRYTVGGMVLSNQNFSLGYIMLEVSSKIHVEISVSQLDMEIFISREKQKVLPQICVASFYI